MSDFSESEREAVYRAIHSRRDMRHFIAGGSVEDDVLERIVEAGHAAPSVGFMQPWRFIRVQDASIRARIADCVEIERQRTAEALGERKQAFLKLKVEGIRECAELMAVVLAPDDGTLFGRRTMPGEMALCSVACAIQNMWLAARAEGIGMGWVSIFPPEEMAEILACPQGAKPVALLCIGPVSEFYAEPMLQSEGWRDRETLQSVISIDRYPVAQGEDEQ